MLNTHESDPCCGKALSKTLLSGALDTASIWTCPKCGLEWKPRTTFTVAKAEGLFAMAEVSLRHWEPHPVVAIVPMRS
jgi:hypothetical protein